MKKILFTMSALLMSVTGFAQLSSTQYLNVALDIQELVLMNAGTGVVEFNLSQTTAGEKLTVTANGSTNWIHSTVVASGDALGVSQNVGTITIAVTDLHPALILKAEAIIPDAAYGAVGQVGVSKISTQQVIGVTPTEAFSDIGTHYTTTGPTSGYQFQYFLEVSDVLYGTLNANTPDAKITYTLQN
tara:strand:+ start:110 stop:670 length:561 start_codon:yes stop_codon:yes gene_type:complete